MARRLTHFVKHERRDVHTDTALYGEPIHLAKDSGVPLSPFHWRRHLGGPRPARHRRRCAARRPRRRLPLTGVALTHSSMAAAVPLYSTRVVRRHCLSSQLSPLRQHERMRDARWDVGGAGSRSRVAVAKAKTREPALGGHPWRCTCVC